MKMPNFKDYKQGRTGGLFPLNFESLILPEHLVRQIDRVVENIPVSKLQACFSEQGASSYHPQMMLKLIVYGYATGNYSCRGIASLTKQDITYMWLCGMQTPDFNTINRFRSVYLKDVLEDVFSEVLLFLHRYGYIKFEDYFVDGTKLEADAGKFTHVWRKNTERYKAAVLARVQTLFEEIESLNNEEDKAYAGMDLPQFGTDTEINSEEVEKVAQLISQKLEEKQEVLKKSEIRTLQSKVNKLEKEKEKLEKYQKQEALLDGRNSYSKTDTDATMMRMKGSDELRPGYNVQISTENQFVTNYSVSQNASDAPDFEEHIDKIADRGEEFLPDTYTGDSAYGTQQNYQVLEKHEIETYLKYGEFYRESKGILKKQTFNKCNFPYNRDEDFYTCPAGRKLQFEKTEQRTTKNGFEYEVKIYKSEDCSDCPLKEKCTKAKGERTIQVNPELEKQKQTARENLNSEKGQELRKRRSPEVETFFGDLKHNQKYERVRLRGLEKAHTEMGWLCLAYNLRKFTNYEKKQYKKAA